jgi:urease accessory protein
MTFDAFVGGALNPLTVPAHLLALLALGLLMGGLPARKLIMSWIAFAIGLDAGLVALSLAVGQTPAIDVLLIVTALNGLLVALALAVPGAVGAILALIVGAALGLDSPPQAISIADAGMSLVGTGLSAALALFLVAFGTSRLTRGWQRIGVRIVGSWVAASAVLVLALRVARGMLFGM